MQLNEETYSYMKEVSSKIENITCELAVYLEKILCVVEEYDYRVYNELFNEIRSKYIDAVVHIKDTFGNTSEAIEEIAVCMCVSDSGKSKLNGELQQFEECLNRLITYCGNIRKCNSKTGNPHIWEANDKIYSVFSGLSRVINEHTLDVPNDDDVIAKTIYGLYVQVQNLYNVFFNECDKMLEELGDELQQRQKKALDTVEKRAIVKEIGKEVVITTVKATNSIVKKEVFSAIDAAIGLVKSISEKLDEVLPQESLARNVLKCIETFGKTMDLIDGIVIKESAGLDDNIMGAIKLFGAALGVSGFDLHRLNKEGKLDVMVNTAEATTAWMVVGGEIVGFAITKNPKNVLKALSKLPKAVDKTMNLIESMSKYYADSGVKELPKCVDTMMRGLAKKIKDYENEVKEHKAKSLRRILTPEPKAPPWYIVHKGVSILSNAIEHIEEIIGGEYNELIGKIL